jgi:predicted aspartyl protease
MDGNWAVVQVMLGQNQRPYTFIVDTGAGATVIDTKLAARVLQPGSLKGSADIQGASGAGTDAGHGTLSELTLAGMRFHDLDVVVTDMSRFGAKENKHYDGILGNDILRRNAYIFDVPAGQLTLVTEAHLDRHRWSQCQPNPLAQRPDGADGFVATSIKLPSGANVMAIIDTGAASTVLNWPAANAAGLSKDGAGVTADKGVVGFDPKAATAAYHGTIGGANVGGISLAPFPARLSDLPVFVGFGLKDRPGAILGINVLSNVPFAVSRQAADFCTASSAPVARNTAGQRFLGEVTGAALALGQLGPGAATALI